MVHYSISLPKYYDVRVIEMASFYRAKNKVKSTVLHFVSGLLNGMEWHAQSVLSCKQITDQTTLFPVNYYIINTFSKIFRYFYTTFL